MAGAVRQPIDLIALTKYIEHNVPEILTPLEIKQFGFGQSNPTYQLISPNGAKYVLRKKPPGALLSIAAHQVEREYRIIHALENTVVPVPKTYCLNLDVSVLGTAFYIMEFLDGRIVTEPWFPGFMTDERREMWQEAIRTLASLHKIDPKSVGLEDFGKPSGFFDRQIKTLDRVASAQSKVVDVETRTPVGKIPHFDELASFFSKKQHQPKDRGTLVHGDYKIDNLVFHKTKPRVIGILDWEMATVGHPLSDFVNLTGPYSWAEAGDVPSARRWMTTELTTLHQKFEAGSVAGLRSRKDCAKLYAKNAGWNPMPDLLWGSAFGSFRSAVIMQGIAARFALRQASGTTAKEHAAQMRPHGEWAWVAVQRLKMAEGPRTVAQEKL